MRRCEDVTERASDRLDGHLPFHERIALIAHLAVCANCRRYLRQFAWTVGLLRRLPAERVDEARAAEVLRRLRDRPRA